MLLAVLIVVSEVEDPELPWRLSDCVIAEASFIDDEVEVATPDTVFDRHVDASLYMSQYKGPHRWTGVPEARVAIASGPPGPAVSISIEVGPRPDDLRLDPRDFFGAARTIAEWLWGSLNLQISPQELQLIEIVTREVQAAIDAGTALIRADLAQTQAALDTIQAQTKAPRPSRRVVLWGLRQIKAFRVESSRLKRSSICSRCSTPLGSEAALTLAIP